MGNRETLSHFIAGTTMSRERPIEDYVVLLGLKDDDLIGPNVIVDLGSGMSERFTTGMRRYGIDTPVISVNPDYKFPEFRDEVTKIESWEERSLAAVGQALPFTDESIDRIFSVSALTRFAVAEQVELDITSYWLTEIGRVLRPGGKGILGPIYGIEERDQLIECISEDLKGDLDISIDAVRRSDGVDVIRTNDGTDRLVQRITLEKPSLPPPNLRLLS